MHFKQPAKESFKLLDTTIPIIILVRLVNGQTKHYEFGISSAVYCVEFILKLYAEPIGYWKSWFNFFDLTVLTITMIAKILRAQDSVDIPKLQGLRVLRALTAFRTLRTVSFIKGLQVK